MITITVMQHSGERTGYTVTGHAEYDDPGKDIVCAAVSALAINTANSLEQISKDRVRSADSSGKLTCDFEAPLSDGGNLLMDSFLLGISEIRKQYPSYIRLRIKEV